MAETLEIIHKMLNTTQSFVKVVARHFDTGKIESYAFAFRGKHKIHFWSIEEEENDIILRYFPDDHEDWSNMENLLLSLYPGNCSSYTEYSSTEFSEEDQILFKRLYIMVKENIKSVNDGFNDILA